MAVVYNVEQRLVRGGDLVGYFVVQRLVMEGCGVGYVVERLVEGKCCCCIVCGAEVGKGRVLLLGMFWCRGW